ncbi:NAD-binding protein [Sanghuangporus baumii]|uniref:NAD-binding protein n=1 Tax=Sanghuangporus baumii TaxID=108892 RepID=A0A9Q5HVS9_SANBA|nr:NAD-binding protein [Sanghuangporus baumii]
MSSSKTSADAMNEAYKKTLARVERIKSHLQTSPRLGRLQGKVCIITGVDSLKGIGRASALLFAHEGAKHLYLLDFSGKNLPELKQNIEKNYPDVKVTTVQADATDEQAIKGLCERALEEEGKLDVFFANAGVVSIDHLDNLTSDMFMRTLRINALSAFLAIKYAAIAMAKPNASVGKSESGGSIILTASVAGLRSGSGPIDYSASKAAVNNMAQTSAFQLAKRNIRVNSICPGLIETGMTEITFDAARRRGTAGKIGQLNPLGRYGVAEEIAQAALFLASDESSYVNAQNFAVDGGLSGSVPTVPGKFH